MRCPNCSSSRDSVVDSRTICDSRVTRRRRACLVCKQRWTTYERNADRSAVCRMRGRIDAMRHELEALERSLLPVLEQDQGDDKL